MDQNDHFPQAWIDWLSQVTEEELIRLANRGTYQRAKKELEGTDIQEFAFDGEQALVQLSEDIRTTLHPWLTEWTCSCPSRSVCKHIMISIFLLQEQLAHSAATSADVPVTDKTDKFAELYAIPWQEIRKEVGARAFDELRFRLELHIPVTFREEAYMTVLYEESGIEVQLPPKDPLVHAVVKPASADRRLYAAESLLRLQRSRGLLQLEELQASNDWQPNVQLLSSLLSMLTELITHGLARLPESVTERLEQFAVKAHRHDMPRIEKKLRNLKTQAEAYARKSASFSATTFKRSIVHLYRDLNAMNKRYLTKVALQLAGEFKSSYYGIPPVRLHACGIQSWTTLSGYMGTTVYLYSNSMQRWFTYTESRPIFYEQSSLLDSSSSIAPWGLQLPLQQFGRTVLQLQEGRANRLGRLSSSEQSSATAEGQTQLAELKVPIYEQWRTLAEDYIRHLGEQDDDDSSSHGPFVACCRVIEWEHPIFNEKSQQLQSALLDVSGKALLIRIPYQPATRVQIRHIEYIASSPLGGGVIIGVVNDVDGMLQINPITYFDETGTRLDLYME